jgi:hypothetical protein
MRPTLPAVVALLLSALLGGSALAAELPDPELAPGALDPAVTQATIYSKICARGWTATIRPPAEYTDNLKRRLLAESGYADRDPRHYELDHRVPLCAGGAASDLRNLWLQPITEARAKDKLEASVCRSICRGEMGLLYGQSMFLGDWRPYLK